MMAFTVDKSIIDPPGIFLAVLHGPNSFSISHENAHTLVNRFRTAPLNGVIIDYSDCTLGHSMEQYNRIAETFGAGLPRGLPFAYVYNQRQLAHVMYMTRQLAGQGLQARAFAEAAEAREWAINAGIIWRKSQEDAA